MTVLSLTGVIIPPTTSAVKAYIDLKQGVYDPATGGFRALPADYRGDWCTCVR